MSSPAVFAVGVVGRGDQHELVGEQGRDDDAVRELGGHRTQREITPARATRDRFRDQDGVQPNDPARGAAAIIATVRAPAAPLRLPLGKEAVARIRTKLERQLTDMESTMNLALSTAYS